MSFPLFKDIQKKILRVVFKKYGVLSAWDLSELTHMKGTPWEITYSQSPDSVIKRGLIEEHFKEIVSPLSFAILLSQE